MTLFVHSTGCPVDTCGHVQLRKCLQLGTLKVDQALVSQSCSLQLIGYEREASQKLPLQMSENLPEPQACSVRLKVSPQGGKSLLSQTKAGQSTT